MSIDRTMEWMVSAKGGQLARLVALGLGVVAVYWLAEMVWLVIPEPDEQPPVVVASAPVPRPEQPDLDARKIAQWHLFGEAGTVEVRDTAPIDAPDTRLNLTLHGLIAADVPENARAIIAEQNRDERSYRIGDNLPGGAELSEIHVDRVILRRAGRYETLRLPKQPLSGNEAMVNTAEAGPQLDPAAAAVLTEYRDIMKTNPRALIDLVRPVPHQEGNQFIGFRLYPGNRRELFTQFGLRPGDLVTEVNGIALDNPAKGIEVLNQLKDAQDLNLHIRRGRQEIDLNFSLS